MHIRRLIERFDKRNELPIEISEVQEAILDLGVQERVIFSPQAMNPLELRGAYYRFIERRVLYGEPERVSLIVFCNTLPIEWQRLVCAKEAVHIFDAPALQPQTAEEVLGLAERLLGPLATETYGVAEAMAATDRLALYYAISLLFPQAAREEALARHTREGDACISDIIDRSCLPEEFVRLVLSKDWPKLCIALGIMAPPDKPEEKSEGVHPAAKVQNDPQINQPLG